MSSTALRKFAVRNFYFILCGILIVSVVVTQSNSMGKLGQIHLNISPDSVEISKGNEVRLICKIECIRTSQANCASPCYAQVVFKQGNKLLHHRGSGDKFQLDSREEQSVAAHLNDRQCPTITETMRITKLDLSDGGVYTCETISTKDKTQSNPAFLVVHGELTVTHATAMVEKKSSMMEMSGQQVFQINKNELVAKQPIQLKCSISLSNQIQRNQIVIQWRQKQKIIDCIKRTNINCTMIGPTENPTGIVTSYLQFTEIFPKDVGEYECIVSASMPFLRATAHLRSAPLVQVHFDNSNMENPIEEQKVRLRCQVYAHPPANLTWKWNRPDSLLSTSAGVQLEELQLDGAMATQDLLFTKIRKDDRAVYICAANNEVDSGESAIFLRVRDKKALIYPLIGIALELAVLIVIILISEWRLYRLRLTSKAKEEVPLFQMPHEAPFNSLTKTQTPPPPTETPTLPYNTRRC